MSLLLPVFEIASSLLLAYVFFVAGYHKLGHRSEFVQVLREYQMLPTWAELPALYVLASVEIATFVLLLSPLNTYGAFLAILMLGLYMVVISVSLASGKKLADCGCGVPGQKTELSSWLLVRNLMLIVLAATIVNQSIHLNPEIASAPSLVWFVAVPLGLSLVGFYVAIGQMHQNQIKLDYLRSYRG